ncbi:MAG: pitrilysin family protein [Bacteroidia bacterium]
MTLNRTIAPGFETAEKINILQATSQKLSNEIPVYSISADTQDLVKIEFWFPAGIMQQSAPLLAATTNAMLIEGTKKYSADELAEKIDYYGAFVESGTAQNSSSFYLYTMNKHLSKTLPFVEDILKNATFPKGQLDVFVQNKKQKYLVNEKKVNHVARKKFSELLLGEKHPCGYNIQLHDYDALKTEQMQQFYKQFYTSDQCKIIISGKIDKELFQLLDYHFGGKDWHSKSLPKNNFSEVHSTKQNIHFLERADALQSAIRIGKILFNKKHPDFFPMQILNTVLGGYFGSRLMSNIREEKGYCYGIGSGLASQQDTGYFYISTEVGVDVCSKALDEIYIELQRLCDTPVGDEELHLVKNYLMGSFMRSVDGPFALADKFKSLMEYELKYDYYDRYFATIKNCTAKQLQELANKYFQKDSMIELVVGKK